VYLYECKECGSIAHLSEIGIVKSCMCGDDVGVIANMSATVYGTSECKETKGSLRVILAGFLTALADKLRGN